MFTQDLNNNVGRRCSVRGDESGRVWRVQVAMTAGRYLVRNVVTGKCRAVSLWSDVSNLY